MTFLSEKPFLGFQGEGPNQGRLAAFVRFAGCNLRCSNCDTQYASYNLNADDFISTDELIKILEVLDPPAIVFTGGEPLLEPFQKVIVDVIRNSFTIPIEIETNGTQKLTIELLEWLSDNDIVNISPKGNFPQNLEIDTTPIILSQKNNVEVLKSGIQFSVKILFDSEKDFEYAEDIVDRYYLCPDNIYMQPKCTTREENIELVNKFYDKIIENQFNLSSRLHVLYFNNKRGV